MLRFIISILISIFEVICFDFGSILIITALTKSVEVGGIGLIIITILSIILIPANAKRIRNNWEKEYQEELRNKAYEEYQIEKYKKEFEKNEQK